VTALEGPSGKMYGYTVFRMIPSVKSKGLRKLTAGRAMTTLTKE
jgi:hypothetical protein